MTLLDAPKFDTARERRRQVFLYSTAGFLLVLFVAWWAVAGRPVDWPWNWNNYLFGRAKVNEFLTAVEKNDLPSAYGIWIHDKNWQQHPPPQTASYPFSRFQDDWSSSSPDNEYGAIQSHQIALAGRYGNGILVAILINGRKSKALNLDYDPKSKTLDFAPPGVELYLGP
ncbi:MAG: hypothetical protein P4L26_15120 [Terracidiphilus sp.]|nr:hypothetical protein [Terracidiphilus sp.]